MPSLEQAYKDFTALWERILSCIKRGDWLAADELCAEPCPLCDYYSEQSMDCLLPNYILVWRGQSMPLCTCQPHRRVVRWLLGTLIRRGVYAVGTDQQFRQDAISLIETVRRGMFSLIEWSEPEGN